jgi:adenylosuccinate lyase
MIDSIIFRNIFGTEEYRQVFEDKTLVQNWLAIEAALAKAEAKLGIIPVEAAEEIGRKASVELLKLEEICEGMAKTKHTIMPVVHALQKLCEGKAGEYVHWGATTQDITDTAVILQVKEVWNLVRRDLCEFQNQLLKLASKHKKTIMPARTHGQQALPTTLGYKFAVWAMEVYRHIQRMDECKQRVLTGLLSGAVGTLAAFGPRGREVQRETLSLLGLEAPVISWHTSRDSITEFVYILTLIAATSAKIAKEVYNLQRTEIQEIEEPFQMGKIGSSTMPHKRNPSLCERIMCLEKIIRGYSGVMGEAMTYPDHDRAMRIAEWIPVGEASILIGAILAHTKALLKGLRVNVERMRANLDLLGGLLLTEPVMFALAKIVGRQTAHSIVYEISMTAIAKKIRLIDALMKDKRVSQNLTREKLEQILKPESYTGLAEELVEDVIRQIGELR